MHFIHFIVILICFISTNCDEVLKEEQLDDVDLKSKYFDVVDNQNEIYESFPDEPLQILKPDTKHKKLVLVEKNLKVSTVLYY